MRAALDLYREAVRIDVTMEGPKFMGSNASALKRAWDADRAALQAGLKAWPGMRIADDDDWCDIRKGWITMPTENSND